jgi:hypothetical protein
MRVLYYSGYTARSSRWGLAPPLLLALLLAMVSLIGSFHYHDDGNIHDDCQTCITSLHSPIESVAGIAISSVISQVYDYSEESFSYFHSTQSSFGIRAPPSSLHA